MVNKLSSKEFNKIYSKVPRICVEIVVKSSEGVLLTKRKISPSNGCWHLPGGGILFDETLEEAIHRVAREEIGVKINIIELVKVIDWWKSKNSFGHPISLVYLVEIISGKIKLDFQASEYGFFKEAPSKTVEEHIEFVNNSSQKSLNIST